MIHYYTESNQSRVWNKHNISSVCEDCMALCKNCTIIFPSRPPKQKDKYVHFPNFTPISCCSLAFHFTLCFSLFIDETEDGGGRPLLTGTNLCVCERVHKYVIYPDVELHSSWMQAVAPKNLIPAKLHCDLTAIKMSPEQNVNGVCLQKPPSSSCFGNDGNSLYARRHVRFGLRELTF